METIEVKLLHLPLKAKWYDMQESGEKPEEYREITPYWVQRLMREYVPDAWGGYDDQRIHFMDKNMVFDNEDIRRLKESVADKDRFFVPYTHVLLRYGYTQRCIVRRIDSISIGRGNPEWGAPTDRDVFIIRHKEDVVVDGWRIEQ